MKMRWIFAMVTFATSASSVAILTACAEDGKASAPPPDEPNTIGPAADSGVEASDGADGASCVDDCEFFPDECTEDALCYGGVFNPRDPSSGLDWRTHVNAIRGRSPGDAWLVGTVGTLAHWSSSSWKTLPLGTQESLSAIWLLGNAEVAFGSPTRLYTRGLDAGADASVGAEGWSYFGPATVPSTWFEHGPGDMQIKATWAYPGSQSLWIGVTTQSLRGGLWRMRYSASDNTFAVAAMLSYDRYGSFPYREVYALDGLSADEFWAVGPEGAAFRMTAAESDNPTVTWFNTLTVNGLHGVWAASPQDVWAVGATGTVRHYRGDARFWEVYDGVPTTQHLRAVAGSSASDIWIAGDEATVFHYDGTSWTRMKIAGLGPRRPRLDRIWVTSPGKVWIAGQGVLVSRGGKP